MFDKRLIYSRMSIVLSKLNSEVQQVLRDAHAHFECCFKILIVWMHEAALWSGLPLFAVAVGSNVYQSDFIFSSSLTMTEGSCACGCLVELLPFG